MLGDKLKELRQKMKLTQEEVAKILNISRGTYAHYEINKRQPDFTTLQKFADFFNVSTDYLLGRTSEASSVPEILKDPSINIAFYEGYQDLSPREQELVKEQVRNTIEMLKKLKQEQKEE
ncbi:helix-turn-helix transcriptional regulator [Aneurinibacillus terranovensis]|uniref:helix-turn-helix transcriptional regulator n=1 Tax=Aneurinibacillus terranovensis TaxID=278991 RepID=UPI0004172058|nr:helix-turn-helix transcriptional regulator [Aneurinibacillus terranovensis]